MIDEHSCQRCQDDPQPSNYRSPRNCAFDLGEGFNPDNWNCATVALAREHAYDLRWNDLSTAIIPLMGVSGEFEGEVLILRYYKDRGCTDSAIVWDGVTVTTAYREDFERIWK